MFVALTVATCGGALLVMLAALGYAWRDRLIDDPLLIAVALVELAVIVQAVIALVRIGSLETEKATFAAYALTLPFVPPFAAWLAIKEKSRWAMASIAIGAGSVAIMTYRMHQIWTLYA